MATNSRKRQRKLLEKNKALSSTQEQPARQPKSFSNYGSASNKTSFIIERDFIEEITKERAQKNTNLRFIAFNDSKGKNKFLNRLFSCIQYSPTFSSVHNSKINYAFGGGFKFAPNISEEDRMKFEAKLDVFKNAAIDFDKTGNAYILVRKGGFDTYLSNLKIYQCRPVKNDLLGYPTEIAISPQFEEEKTTSIPDEQLNILPLYPKFGVEKLSDGTTFESSIIHIKNYSSTASYWGVPSWSAALFAMELEYRAIRYNISELENGFVPSAIITMKGQYSPDEQNVIKKDFQEGFLNTGNNSKIWMLFDADSFTVEKFDSRKDGQFLEMLQTAESQILKATQFTPAMAGIKTPGQLGSNQQLQDEYEMVSNNVIKPLQKKIYQELVLPYLELTNQIGKVLGFNQNSPISMRSQININEITTINERRVLLGLEPATDDELAQINRTSVTIQ
jgi:hypothetical protein